MNSFIQKTLQRIKNNEKVSIWFDIDGTITDTDFKDYNISTPDEAMITLINNLYDRGHRIILFTARGGISGIDWRETTENQLKKWGLKYDELITGYPKDLIVDDCALRPDEFLEMIE